MLPRLCLLPCCLVPPPPSAAPLRSLLARAASPIPIPLPAALLGVLPAALLRRGGEARHFLSLLRQPCCSGGAGAGHGLQATIVAPTAITIPAVAVNGGAYAGAGASSSGCAVKAIAAAACFNSSGGTGGSAGKGGPLVCGLAALSQLLGMPLQAACARAVVLVTLAAVHLLLGPGCVIGIVAASACLQWMQHGWALRCACLPACVGAGGRAWGEGKGAEAMRGRPLATMPGEVLAALRLAGSMLPGRKGLQQGATGEGAGARGLLP